MAGSAPMWLERNEKVPNLRITFSPKTKTSALILEILKILIQNQVLWVNFTYKSCWEKDARHRYMNRDAKHRVSSNIRGFGSFFLRSNLFPFVEWEINHAFP